MPTGTSDHAGVLRRALAALLLPALLVPLLAACGDDAPARRSNPEAEAAEAIQRTLRQRARAIVAGDQVAFGRTLGKRDPAFLTAQRDYFDNLRQLPLGTVRFDLAEQTIEPDGDAYWVEVTVRLELEGYDAAPVVTRDRWRFAPTNDARRHLLTSTRDAGWEAVHGSRPQPWDLGEIEVRERPGVLGIFDDTTLASADAVLDAVSDGRYEVGNVLPETSQDPDGVVVYALADPSFVENLGGLPVSDPDRLDALTVPVPRRAADPDGPMASYRILLSPHVLDEADGVLDRLVRHELTHVALGDRARGVPLWLSEGVAEYVSVRPIAPADRRLQTDALDLAASGVDDVPDDGEFGGPDAEGWYAVSWWICEFVAATYGEPALWALLDGLAGGGDQQSVVREQLGITTSELVESSIGLMRRTYG